MWNLHLLSCPHATSRLALSLLYPWCYYLRLLSPATSSSHDLSLRILPTQSHVNTLSFFLQAWTGTQNTHGSSCLSAEPSWLGPLRFSLAFILVLIRLYPKTPIQHWRLPVKRDIIKSQFHSVGKGIQKKIIAVLEENWVGNGLILGRGPWILSSDIRGTIKKALINSGEVRGLVCRD